MSLQPIVIAASAILIDTDQQMLYYRAMLRSINRQTQRPVRMYVAESGRFAGVADVTSLLFECVRVTSIVAGTRWSQFEGYRAIVERMQHDYTSDELDRAWMLFSDGDDLWAPIRYKETCDGLEIALKLEHSDILTALVLMNMVENVDENDGPTFLKGQSIDRGLVAGKIVKSVMRAEALPEYVNIIPRFRLLREFIDSWAPVLDTDVVDLYFASFVRTYDAGSSHTAILKSEYPWTYFYRIHNQSLSCCSTADEVKTNNRNTDLFLITSATRESLESAIRRSYNPKLPFAIRALHFTHIFARVHWWLDKLSCVTAPSAQQLRRRCENTARLLLDILNEQHP